MCLIVYASASSSSLFCGDLQEAFKGAGCCSDYDPLHQVSANPCIGSPYNVWVFECEEGMVEYCRLFVEHHAEYMRTTNHVGVGASSATPPYESVVTNYVKFERAVVGNAVEFVVLMTFADAESETAHVMMSLETPMDLGMPRPLCPELGLVTADTNLDFQTIDLSAEVTNVFRMITGLLFGPSIFQNLNPPHDITNPQCGITVKHYLNKLGGRYNLTDTGYQGLIGCA